MFHLSLACRKMYCSFQDVAIAILICPSWWINMALLSIKILKIRVQLLKQKQQTTLMAVFTKFLI